MKMILFLIENGAKMVQNNLSLESLLHTAIKNQKILPLIFYSQFLNLNQPDSQMRTPLMTAAIMRDCQIIEFLIS